MYKKTFTADNVIDIPVPKFPYAAFHWYSAISLLIDTFVNGHMYKTVSEDPGRFSRIYYIETLYKRDTFPSRTTDSYPWSLETKGSVRWKILKNLCLWFPYRHDKSEILNKRIYNDTWIVNNIPIPLCFSSKCYWNSIKINHITSVTKESPLK